MRTSPGTSGSNVSFSRVRVLKSFRSDMRDGLDQKSPSSGGAPLRPYGVTPPRRRTGAPAERGRLEGADVDGDDAVAVAVCPRNAALIGRGSVDGIAAVDGRTAGPERHRLRRSSVVRQRTEKGIGHRHSGAGRVAELKLVSARERD